MHACRGGACTCILRIGVRYVRACSTIMHCSCSCCVLLLPACRLWPAKAKAMHAKRTARYTPADRSYIYWPSAVASASASAFAVHGAASCASVPPSVKPCQYACAVTVISTGLTHSACHSLFFLPVILFLFFFLRKNTSYYIPEMLANSIIFFPTQIPKLGNFHTPRK